MNTVIVTPTNDPETSLDFYTRLNFKVLSRKDVIFVSDGKAIIEIDPDRFARAGLKLYRLSWQEIIPALEESAKITKIENGYILADPSGTWIYLIEGVSPYQNKAEGACFSTLGNFAGLSLETTDITRSIKIWELLGFEKTMGGIEQGWIVFSNQDGMGVSLMKPYACPHLFFNPSLTYFNGKDNLVVIEKIRELNIPITEEITHFNKEGIVDNIVIRDPGGFGFFIFSD